MWWLFFVLIWAATCKLHKRLVVLFIRLWLSVSQQPHPAVFSVGRISEDAYPCVDVVPSLPPSSSVDIWEGGRRRSPMTPPSDPHRPSDDGQDKEAYQAELITLQPIKIGRESQQASSIGIRGSGWTTWGETGFIKHCLKGEEWAIGGANEWKHTQKMFYSRLQDLFPVAAYFHEK